MKQIASMLILVGMMACNQTPAPDYISTHFKVVKLSDGVYACIHRFGGKAICNVGIIDNGKESIVFDTFLSPDVAAEIKKVIKYYGLSPVKYVVNSHAHNDHMTLSCKISMGILPSEPIKSYRCGCLISKPWPKAILK